MRSIARLVAFLSFVASSAALAGTPSSGTLSVATPTLTYTYGPNVQSNPSGDAGGVNCTAAPCDHYALTIDLPADYAVTNPKDTIRISTSWSGAADDYDIYLLSPTDKEENKSAGSANPEVMTMPAGAGTSSHKIRIVPFAVTGSTATTKITLVTPPPPPPDADGDGITDANDLCPGTPPGTSVDATGCPLPAGDPATCTEPGVTLLTDASGDSTSGAPGTDLKSFQLAQPPQVPAGDRIEDQSLTFRINISAGATPSPATSWFVSFSSPIGTQGVRMTGDNSGNPVFQSYVVGASNSGATDGRFVASSKATTGTFNAATGAITIRVKVTDIGLTAPGQKLQNFNSGVTQTTGGVATAVDDGMPNNNLSRSTVSYTLHDNTVCGGPQLKPVGPPPPASGLAPRFQVHPSPPALGNNAGEPSIGFNPLTKRTMFISNKTALRETYPELSTLKDVAGNPLPQSCDATWVSKPGTLTNLNTLDPILFTDQATGRTFNSQLSGDNSLFEFTDNDGDTWSPGQAGPPNGGADHQAVASGVYPAGQVPPNALWPATGPKRAVYYCSQSVASAFCSRSDDGGQSFGPGIPVKDTDCAAGALHGHVKVAPDGTVYVPDTSKCVTALGDTAKHVIAFASGDAGKTWTPRPIKQSTGGGGSDPSLGIATDGTDYMCYVEPDGTVHAAVSKDKGLTWAHGQDIGLAEGILHAVFPQMIAGDPNRASCAFIGTSTAGNSGAADFKGVWYGYQATTYDGGDSWHLVNVTPGDPVQGQGGVCTGGTTCGTNRNLLDFNDLQLDEQGRTLFGFSDGCIGGCVKDPSANSFANKATIVRQTGGRTLYTKFDDASGLASAVPRYNAATPIAPAAACARQDISQRTVVQTNVIWNAPDTGGSPITNYKVYRATGPAGPFDLLGDAGTKTSFLDTTTKPSVEKYYYQVEAYNALGVAPLSNVIELAVSAAAVDTCKLPGEIIIQDPVGDGNADDTDIVYIGVAEPEAFADSFVITEKVVKFTSGQPPVDSFYPILFPTKGSLYVSLDATQGLPKFTYGTYTAGTAGLLTFTEKGLLDSRSKFTADGTITMVVPRVRFGSPAIGGVISGFDARTRVGSQSATSRDTAGPSDYTVRGTAICADPGTVLANLSATTTTGNAPLDVTFTVSGTQSKGKSVDSYSILFGDEPSGAAPTTGSFGGQGSVQVLHTYQSQGTYRASATVTDAATQTSSNLAEQTITVLSPTSGGGGGATTTSAGATALGNNKVGGGMSPFGVLILGLLGALSRRRVRPPST